MSKIQKNHINDFSIGFISNFKAFTFLFKHRLGHFFIYPVAVSIGLLLLTKIGIESTVNWVTSVLYEKTGIQPFTSGDWPQTAFEWIAFVGEKITTLMLWLGLFFVAHKIIKYVVLILMSPIMALLSERTEKIITGNNYPFTINQFLHDIIRGILLASRNIIIELVLLLLAWGGNFFLTTIFPPLSLLTTPLLIVVNIIISAYFYGFSTIDYINERKRMTISESYQYIRKNKALTIGNGLVFWGMVNIPFLGTYIGTIFAPILCSCGAVLAVHEKEDLISKNLLITKNELLQNTRKNESSKSLN